MNWLRKLVFPLVPIYYIGALINKKLYDWGIKESISYNFPLITVGNLSVGGTGKSPMVAYLIQLLIKDTKIATLSRGYKRSTKGFQLAQKNSTVQQIGDEPLQFKLNFPEAIVAVDADRRNGIAQLFKLKENPEVVILDDAFQHRRVKAGLQILLTSYNNLYSKDYMLPSGNLREPISGAQRANIVVVTKCPINLTIEEREAIKKSLKIAIGQQLFFTSINYSLEVKSYKETILLQNYIKRPFVLVTGIANTQPLEDYLDSLGAVYEHYSYADHHNFSDKEITKLSKCERILTTEKDFMRLSAFAIIKRKLFYLPITVSFIENQHKFDSLIFDFMSIASK